MKKCTVAILIFVLTIIFVEYIGKFIPLETEQLLEDHYAGVSNIELNDYFYYVLFEMLPIIIIAFTFAFIKRKQLKLGHVLGDLMLTFVILWALIKIINTFFNIFIAKFCFSLFLFKSVSIASSLLFLFFICWLIYKKLHFSKKMIAAVVLSLYFGVIIVSSIFVSYVFYPIAQESESKLANYVFETEYFKIYSLDKKEIYSKMIIEYTIQNPLITRESADVLVDSYCLPALQEFTIAYKRDDILAMDNKNYIELLNILNTNLENKDIKVLNIKAIYRE